MFLFSAYCTKTEKLRCDILQFPSNRANICTRYVTARRITACMPAPCGRAPGSPGIAGACSDYVVLSIENTVILCYNHKNTLEAGM